MDSTHEDIQNSLNLFQTFKRLYEQNPALLDEILSLANGEKPLAVRPGNFSYVLGLITDRQAWLVTNLSEERSQIFLQPHLHNQVWSIGRDPSRVSLFVQDRRLSRCHAAIRYHPTYGFILYDLDSTNGTYVNGIRVRQSHLLNDGDLVRLGSLNFGFFTGAEFRRVNPPVPEITRQLHEPSLSAMQANQSSERIQPKPRSEAQRTPVDDLEKTLHFMRQVERP